MKMDSMNISLPLPMAEFVRQNVEQDYGNVSEFFRDLIRQKMASEIEKDLKFLHKTGRASAGPSDKDLENIARIQSQVRKELNANRS